MASTEREERQDMCWSGEASAFIAVAGFNSAYFLKKNGQPKEIYIPPAYFVLMEGLQAVTYAVVDDYWLFGLPSSQFSSGRAEISLPPSK